MTLPADIFIYKQLRRIEEMIAKSQVALEELQWLVDSNASFFDNERSLPSVSTPSSDSALPYDVRGQSHATAGSGPAPTAANSDHGDSEKSTRQIAILLLTARVAQALCSQALLEDDRVCVVLLFVWWLWWPIPFGLCTLLTLMLSTHTHTHTTRQFEMQIQQAIEGMLDEQSQVRPVVAEERQNARASISMRVQASRARTLARQQATWTQCSAQLRELDARCEWVGWVAGERSLRAFWWILTLTTFARVRVALPSLPQSPTRPTNSQRQIYSALRFLDANPALAERALLQCQGATNNQEPPSL